MPESAADLSDEELLQAQVFWATVDSPWLHDVDGSVLAAKLDVVRRMEPTMILSSHLPPAPGNLTERLLHSLAAVPTASPFIGPDQAALEDMLAKATGAIPTA